MGKYYKSILSIKLLQWTIQSVKSQILDPRSLPLSFSIEKYDPPKNVAIKLALLSCHMLLVPTQEKYSI